MAESIFHRARGGDGGCRQTSVPAGRPPSPPRGTRVALTVFVRLFVAWIGFASVLLAMALFASPAENVQAACTRAGAAVPCVSHEVSGVRRADAAAHAARASAKIR